MSALEMSANKIVRDPRPAKCLLTTRALTAVICTRELISCQIRATILAYASRRGPRPRTCTSSFVVSMTAVRIGEACLHRNLNFRNLALSRMCSVCRVSKLHNSIDDELSASELPASIHHGELLIGAWRRMPNRVPRGRSRYINERFHGFANLGFHQIWRATVQQVVASVYKHSI